MLNKGYLTFSMLNYLVVHFLHLSIPQRHFVSNVLRCTFFKIRFISEFLLFSGHCNVNHKDWLEFSKTDSLDRIKLFSSATPYISCMSSLFDSITFVLITFSSRTEPIFSSAFSWSQSGSFFTAPSLPQESLFQTQVRSYP